MNFVLRTKKKNLVALRPVQRPFSDKTVFIQTNTPNFFLTPNVNEQILYAAVNLVLNAYKTISPEPCCFRKLFGGFSTFCALARPSTCKHSRVGREPGRACAGTRSGSAGTEDFLTRRRERACAGTRTGSAAAEDFRAARRPHAKQTTQPSTTGVLSAADAGRAADEAGQYTAFAAWQASAQALSHILQRLEQHDSLSGELFVSVASRQQIASDCTRAGFRSNAETISIAIRCACTSITKPS